MREKSSNFHTVYKAQCGKTSHRVQLEENFVKTAHVGTLYEMRYFHGIFAVVTKTYISSESKFLFFPHCGSERENTSYSTANLFRA